MKPGSSIWMSSAPFADEPVEFVPHNAGDVVEQRRPVAAIRAFGRDLGHEGQGTGKCNLETPAGRQLPEAAKFVCDAEPVGRRHPFPGGEVGRAVVARHAEPPAGRNPLDPGQPVIHLIDEPAPAEFAVGQDIHTRLDLVGNCDAGCVVEGFLDVLRAGPARAHGLPEEKEPARRRIGPHPIVGKSIPYPPFRAQGPTPGICHEMSCFVMRAGGTLCDMSWDVMICMHRRICHGLPRVWPPSFRWRGSGPSPSLSRERERRFAAADPSLRSAVQTRPAYRFLHRVSFHFLPFLPPLASPGGETLIRA